LGGAPRLLEQVSIVCRRRHFSTRTEESPPTNHAARKRTCSDGSSGVESASSPAIFSRGPQADCGRSLCQYCIRFADIRMMFDEWTSKWCIARNLTPESTSVIGQFCRISSLRSDHLVFRCLALCDHSSPISLPGSCSQRMRRGDNLRYEFASAIRMKSAQTSGRVQ